MKRSILGCLPLFLAVALGGTVLSARSQEMNTLSATNFLTLADAVRMAVNHSPELLGLSAGVAAAQGDALTARTWNNPELSVTPGAFRDAQGTWGHAGLELKQTIVFPGKRALVRALAEKNVETKQLALTAFQTQLAIEVRRAWNDLLMAKQITRLKEQQLTLADSFAEAARKKAQGGFAPESEIVKAEAELVKARKALLEAEGQAAVANATLNSLLGNPPNTPLALAGPSEDDLPLPEQSAILTAAVAGNPAVKLQLAEVQRTGLNLALTRKSRWPDFSIGPTIEYQEPEQVYGLGISLPLPLWDKKKGAIATATAEQQRALADLETLRRDIIRDASRAWQQWNTAQESLAAYTPEFRERLKSTLDTAAQGYAEGRTPLLLYLETQRTYFDLQGDYFETLKNLHAARAQLESAAGVPLKPTLFP